jgi:predicted nucleic acid-binding protein
VANPSRAVFDANVLVRALVDEVAEARMWIERLAAQELRVSVPDLIYAECASALARHGRAGRLEFSRVFDVIARIVRLPFEPTPSRQLALPACALAEIHGITTYDAHYLALAEAEGAVLVTADRGLAAAASRSVLLA